MVNLKDVVKLYDKAVKIGHKPEEDISVKDVIKSVERRDKK